MPNRVVEQDELLATGYSSLVPGILNKVSRFSGPFLHLSGKGRDREGTEEVQWEELDGVILGVGDVH